jgi:hypothetical protein
MSLTAKSNKRKIIINGREFDSLVKKGGSTLFCYTDKKGALTPMYLNYGCFDI